MDPVDGEALAGMGEEEKEEDDDDDEREGVVVRNSGEEEPEASTNMFASKDADLFMETLLATVLSSLDDFFNEVWCGVPVVPLDVSMCPVVSISCSNVLINVPCLCISFSFSIIVCCNECSSISFNATSFLKVVVFVSYCRPILRST